MGEIKDIHDRFFKKLFFKEENVKDFLKLLDFKYILFGTNDLEIGS